MKTLIKIDEWNRKEHFLFFSQFEEPFFGVTVAVDCTKAYQKAKNQHSSFFLYYLYRALVVANKIEHFRYRILDKQPYLFDKVNASPTINRPNGTFGFGYMDYHEDEHFFYISAKEEIEQVRNTNTLTLSGSEENYIHFSAIPWINFTSVSHARSFSFHDSCPKISFGKMTDQHGIKSMPVSIHVHHALMDASHVGIFVDKFQALLDE